MAPRNAQQEMSTSDIKRTIGDFARCAVLAKQAGYDGVEVCSSAVSRRYVLTLPDYGVRGLSYQPISCRAHK